MMVDGHEMLNFLRKLDPIDLHLVKGNFKHK
ncbi:hypothetical protein MEPL4_4c02750 [Melissococcus plutonius]|nr:hypothetical protein MEPL_c012570 [Melissococcus plutonius S1]KMT25432.1 hypothetical protein MEPL2_2c10040 [Melissococcus plutonius]KMT25472.1 hypothetical protein MEPL3_5c00390 [Melissococcus plutonius]KMT26336.1 hypothetical protein MEPL1_5c01070 [Melissococcus plutonius]KMT29078.1 hypothetical protein MEPL4_4c02750 [Melissococcus plutonius]